MNNQKNNKEKDAVASAVDAIVIGNSTGLVVHINELCRSCGYFNGDTNVNNGYGCDHPDQEEVDEDNEGNEQGKCYSFSCPLAVECDLQDLREHDQALYDEWKYEEYPPQESGAELVLVHDKELIKKLR